MVTGNEYIFDNIDQALTYVLDLEKRHLANDVYRQKAPAVMRANATMFMSPAPDTLPLIPIDSLDYPLTAWFNDVSDDLFVMTRLYTGRFSLKPNLRNRKFLFRGESDFHSPCKPNLCRNPKQKRFTKELMKGQEMILLMLSHPLVQLLDMGVELNGTVYRFEMNLLGLTQHYYNKTSFLDLTSNPLVAAFFATTKYEWESDTYTPIEDANAKPGVLYYYDLDINQDFGIQLNKKESTLSTIGLQVFPRSGKQSGFLYALPTNEDFNQIPRLNAVRFHHNAEIANRIMTQFQNGKDLFPNDILMKHWRQTNADSNVISRRTLMLNHYNNQDMTFEQVEQEAISLNLEIQDYRPCFTTEELDEYYNSVWNQNFWSDFCDKIHIPGDKQGKMKKDLLELPNNPNYRWAFTPSSKHDIDYNKGFLLRKYQGILR